LAIDFLEGLSPEGAFAREEGWTKLPATAFSAVIGAIHVRGEPGARTVALDCGPEIGNDRVGNVHGGALMTFADIALGVGIADQVGHARMATVQLQYSFAGGVRVGARLTCRPEPIRRTATLIFMRGLFEADGKVIGSAEGIYRVFEPEPSSPA
jgi:acyl-coenzyme A thioesterase PaaI-like protein